LFAEGCWCRIVSDVFILLRPPPSQISPWGPITASLRRLGVLIVKSFLSPFSPLLFFDGVGCTPPCRIPPFFICRTFFRRGICPFLQKSMLVFSSANPFPLSARSAQTPLVGLVLWIPPLNPFTPDYTFVFFSGSFPPESPHVFFFARHLGPPLSLLAPALSRLHLLHFEPRVPEPSPAFTGAFSAFNEAFHSGTF